MERSSLGPVERLGLVGLPNSGKSALFNSSGPLGGSDAGGTLFFPPETTGWTSFNIASTVPEPVSANTPSVEFACGSQLVSAPVASSTASSLWRVTDVVQVCWPPCMPQ